ncbi:type II toxin-antitoxin system MqsR family toxin [Inquilinus sp. NPDC058860]|uniref:type II toxin-antitoxin system MqsR family toxin n=1 Tax=Inquilinus sp. NPDC058860 TaxID=3346652 RepID=UPI0036ADA80D
MAAIKAAFANPSTMNRTVVSKQGADALKMADAQVVAVIQALIPADFDKSMTSLANHKIWQDVYRPTTTGTSLYVKFTTDSMGAYLLISFKEA